MMRSIVPILETSGAGCFSTGNRKAADRVPVEPLRWPSGAAFPTRGGTLAGPVSSPGDGRVAGAMPMTDEASIWRLAALLVEKHGAAAAHVAQSHAAMPPGEDRDERAVWI